jgi:hypothetical protein
MMIRDVGLFYIVRYPVVNAWRMLDLAGVSTGKLLLAIGDLLDETLVPYLDTTAEVARVDDIDLLADSAASDLRGILRVDAVRRDDRR